MNFPIMAAKANLSQQEAVSVPSAWDQRSALWKLKHFTYGDTPDPAESVRSSTRDPP